VNEGIFALEKALKRLSLSVKKPETIERFSLYASELQKANAVMNLTAVDDTVGIFVRHFADSLSVFAAGMIQRGHSVIDVGCGAGFPGLPLKIFAHDQDIPLRLTLMDATGKKIAFLERLSEKLGLPDITCVSARAEEAGREEAFRETYDVAVSRAVARFSVLAELCLPFVKKGGHMAAIKSALVGEELAAAEKAISTLSGGKATLFAYQLLETEPESRVVIVEKKNTTPSPYPRSFAKIRKNPLETAGKGSVLQP
jgi:16S rRNA (guanine527-N7)-methyltransferase